MLNFYKQVIILCKDVLETIGYRGEKDHMGINYYINCYIYLFSNFNNRDIEKAKSFNKLNEVHGNLMYWSTKI